jgi:ketosteroid isomerase-like protein
MNKLLFLIPVIVLSGSCSHSMNSEEIKQEIFQTEKAFEKMAAEEGVAHAFYFFADEMAVIKRENDTLIIGKENIKNYYERKVNQKATVTWTPDFIDVSDCGTWGYTYGKYIWRITKSDSSIAEYKGIFHTVWKKQKDNTWKYVWD